jgi:hypothetical protein
LALGAWLRNGLNGRGFPGPLSPRRAAPRQFLGNVSTTAGWHCWGWVFLQIRGTVVRGSVVCGLYFIGGVRGGLWFANLFWRAACPCPVPAPQPLAQIPNGAGLGPPNRTSTSHLPLHPAPAPCTCTCTRTREPPIEVLVLLTLLLVPDTRHQTPDTSRDGRAGRAPSTPGSLALALTPRSTAGAWGLEPGAWSAKMRKTALQ